MYDGDLYSAYPTFDDLENNENQFVQKCVKLIATWYDYFADNNRQSRDDIYFLHMDQWASQDRAARTLQRQPVLNFNVLRPILLQLCGEQRSQQPDLIVEPKDPQADMQLAKIVSGLLRDQDYRNKSDIIYQTGFKYALEGGYSAFFNTIEYESPKTNDQYVKRQVIENCTSAFFDPNAKEQDKSDGFFSGYMSDIQREQFKKLYPNANTDMSFPTFRNDPLYYNYWYVKDYIRVADLWIKLEYKESIVTLSDGSSGPKSEMDEKIEENKQQRRKFFSLRNKGLLMSYPEPPELEIIDSRESVCYQIMHVRMCYNEILEIEEWPIDMLPGVFLDCDSEMIDGRQLTISFFRFAQDPQRYLNYLKSQSAEALLNAHHLTWIGTPDNVKGNLLQYWKNPQMSKTILLANYDEKGNLPQPVPPPAISPSLETQAQATMNDIMNVTGRYEATMGKQGNERSGVAVDKRALYGSMASFAPFDNLKRAMIQCNKITLALLSVIMKNKQQVSMRDKRGNLSFIKINQKVGDKTYNDVKDFNKFNVRIEMGAPFAVQKMANFQMMLGLLQASPEIGPLIADLLADNLDLENSAQIVDRLKMMIVPPQIIAKEEGKQPPPPDPKKQAIQEAMQTLPIQDMQIKQQKVDIEKAELEIKKAEAAHAMRQDDIHNQIEMSRLQTEIMNINERKEETLRDHKIKKAQVIISHPAVQAKYAPREKSKLSS